MTTVIAALAQISQPYDAVFCDLWGCLHNGVSAFPAAVAALQQFRAQGGRVVLVTNAPRPSRFVIAGLDRIGVPRSAWDAVVSSGDAAQDALFSGAVGRRVWHLGPAKDDGFFTQVPAEWADAPPVERVPLTEAEAIVCTGPFDELTEAPEDYRPRLLLAKARGLPMLCANPDLVVDMGARRIYCAGAIAALYEEMGGQALYFGKPHPPIYDLAMRRLAAFGGAGAGRVLAIGDGIGTDIAGAAGEGFDALFITGGLAAADFGPDPANPDPQLLNAWLARHQQAPLFAMGYLG
jgi:HAD superfamily hydrolase (TIGR01459 family)